MKVDGAGDEVLADAAFAGQQHGGAGGGYTDDGGEDLLHGSAAAYDVVKLVAAAELLAKLPVFVAQGAHLERLLDDGSQVVERKRLGEEIDRAGLHGFNGGFHTAVSR